MNDAEVREAWVLSRLNEEGVSAKVLLDAAEEFDEWLGSVRESGKADMVGLIDSLVDSEDCWFDHDGGCQAHGYYALGGQMCPQAEAKQWLARRPAL